MRTLVRKALDQIEDVLLLGNQDSADLAAILSALRGPDEGVSDHNNTKLTTTVPVRREAFPRLAGAKSFLDITPVNGWYLGGSDDRLTVPTVDSVEYGTDHKHFANHYRMAYDAIKREDPPTPPPTTPTTEK